MKPLNYDNSPCSPISSNCVIWQGPDIPCIKLCAGDTISDVVFKLATELCTVLDTLNVTNYDLSCFNLVACGPNDFQALIQFLIEREYNTVKKPRHTAQKSDIKEAIYNGYTSTEAMKKLNVSRSTFFRHKSKERKLLEESE